MLKDTEKLTVLLPKLLPVLEQWCITYKLIGSQDETPRYSQLLPLDGENYVLKSTQKRLFYELDLSEAENFLLINTDTKTLWAWWKDQRTKYLLENHPTISIY